MVRVTIYSSVTKETYDEIDTLIKQGIYESVYGFFQAAIKEQLTREKGGQNGFILRKG